MKLLVVDHNALEPLNRKLYEAIVNLGGIELRLIVPTKWNNTFTTLRFESPAEKLPYELFSSEVLFHSRTHRLIYRSLAKHVRRFSPDVLYMNAEPENFQSYEAALMKKSSKLVFSSWRNVDHAVDGYPYKLSFIHKFIEKFVLQKSTHGILFNNSAKKIFDRLGFTQTSVIPPPVDISIFAPMKREKRSKFVIGFVGRLVKAKGVEILLKVLATLPQSCEAMIVGDGPERESLQTLANELGILSRAQFVGAVASAKLPLLLATMDVVVLPSLTTRHWKEQFGRVLIEAMACGIPVLGSTSGEIPNVIGDAGLIFKEGSVEGLRLGIERLRGDASLREDVGARGLRRVQTDYALQVVARQYHTLFTTL
jgi:glycosyltransferase involved in cell wall biosynthesis